METYYSRSSSSSSSSRSSRNSSTSNTITSTDQDTDNTNKNNHIAASTESELTLDSDINCLTNPKSSIWNRLPYNDSMEYHYQSQHQQINQNFKKIWSKSMELLQINDKSNEIVSTNCPQHQYLSRNCYYYDNHQHNKQNCEINYVTKNHRIKTLIQQQSQLMPANEICHKDYSFNIRIFNLVMMMINNINSYNNLLIINIIKIILLTRLKLISLMRNQQFCWRNQHKFMNILLIILIGLSTTCLAIRQDAASECIFPQRWEGSWFLSGYQQSIHIKSSQFSYRGKCKASDGNKYLIVDEKGCHRCLVIYEKHKNVLQYKESECEGDSMYMDQSMNPAAMPMRSIVKSDHNRGGGGAHPNINGHTRLSSSDQYIMRSNDDSNDCFCRGREILQNLCDQIPGDALLYSLFREQAEPVKCPLKGPFTFTYNRGHGECRSPVSNIESCTDDSRLLLNFQACPDVQGTESAAEELTCLATWKDGNSRYLVGLVSHHHAISNEERFRCFVYEKISSMMGTFPGNFNGPMMKDAEYKLAQSGDATCNGLDSAEVGSRIMTLRKPPLTERCDFPTWFKGPRHWHGLMGKSQYIFHPSDGSMQIKNPSGNMETRAFCEQINKQTATEMMAVVHHTTGCLSGFMCMMFYRRDTHIAEIQIGTPASRLEDACASDHFDIVKMQYITLLASSPEQQICPLEGLYTLQGAIGPPHKVSRHKRNHNNNNKNHNQHTSHHNHHHHHQHHHKHQQQSQLNEQQLSEEKRHGTFILQNTNDEWHQPQLLSSSLLLFPSLSQDRRRISAAAAASTSIEDTKLINIRRRKRHISVTTTSNADLSDINQQNPIQFTSSNSDSMIPLTNSINDPNKLLTTNIPVPYASAELLSLSSPSILLSAMDTTTSNPNRIDIIQPFGRKIIKDLTKLQLSRNNINEQNQYIHADRFHSQHNNAQLQNLQTVQLKQHDNLSMNKQTIATAAASSLSNTGKFMQSIQILNQRNRRETPGCIVNYKDQRQLWIGCTEPNIIDVRPQCNDDGEEEYYCHGSWNENGTIYVIAKHSGTQHGVCITYQPLDNKEAKLIIGDSCIRPTMKPADHHLIANIKNFGKCGDPSSSNLIASNLLLIIITIITSIILLRPR